MPIHDGERWLAETLDSVAAQDCRGVELLVFDSGRDESCRAIIDRFADRLDITYEHMPDVPSWPGKTNRGATRARAAHLSILHQDDLWLPERTARARLAIADYPDAALLLGPAYIVDERSRRRGLWRCPLPAQRRLSAAEVAEQLLVQNFISMPAPVINRAAWLAVGGMDEQLWSPADWDLYLKLAAAGTTVYLPEPTSAFRIHGNSLTVSGSRNQDDFSAQMRQVLDRHHRLVPEGRRAQVRRRAEASVAINCALARAAAGAPSGLFAALRRLVALGPAEAIAYLRTSRITERALPRLRARLAGSF